MKRSKESLEGNLTLQKPSLGSERDLSGSESDTDFFALQSHKTRKLTRK